MNEKDIKHASLFSGIEQQNLQLFGSSSSI